MGRFVDLFSDPEVDLDLRKGSIQQVLDVDTITVTSPGHSYQLVKYLTSGTFGDIFIAKAEQKLVVLKIMRANPDTLREILAYQKLLPTCGSYINTVYEAFFYRDADMDWLVEVQHMMRGDFADTVCPNFYEIGYMLYVLLSGVDLMHEMGIAHMDIKPENVFWTRDEGYLDIKLADPGLCCAREPITTTIQGKTIILSSCKIRGTFIPLNLFYSDYNDSIPLAKPSTSISGALGSLLTYCWQV